MPRGRPPKITEQDNLAKKDKGTKKDKYTCFYCGNNYINTNYYKSYSEFYSNIGKIPYCKQCIEKFYQYYFDKYTNEGCTSPERKAIKRVCMALDIYYVEKVFNSAMNKVKESDSNISPMAQYMRIIQLSQYQDESYDTTIKEEELRQQKEFERNSSFDDDSNDIEIDEKTIKFFGKGFEPEDYAFLQEQYEDWVTRHECQTKAQEEIFKRICFKQLEILKATRRGEDTKNLDDTFQKLLDTAKLQPKQNSGETVSDAQTFGTLIDKWENTRPLPEIDEELKDVDKIAWYVDVFYRGHLSKMMGLKNGLSNLYNKFIKKYTVDKPEYNDDENSEVLFDAIFGNQSLDSDDERG